MTVDNIANVYGVEAHVHTLFDIPYVVPLKQIGTLVDI
jgi:iron complex transport system ATP-binding protein